MDAHRPHKARRLDRYQLSPPIASLVQLDRAPGYEPVRLGVQISQDAPKFTPVVKWYNGGLISLYSEFNSRWEYQVLESIQQLKISLLMKKKADSVVYGSVVPIGRTADSKSAC